MLYPNNWIPTKTLEQMENTTYDVLIVGTGAGGGAVLYRLCELWKNRGAKNIGILEKGEKLFHSHSLNIPTMNIDRMFSGLFIDNSTPIGIELPQFPGVREVFALGGRTLFWFGTCPRPPEFELKKWPINYNELNAYFDLAEKVMNVTEFYARGSVMQSVILNRLQANGILEATDLPLAIDMRGTRYGQVYSNPWFASINFLAYAYNNRLFDLALNAYVSRVIVENGKVIGAEALGLDKQPHIIKAKTIVISASALETPRILLNSEIEGDNIGHYLTSHISVFAGGRLNRRQFSENLGNLAILQPEILEKPYQIQITGPGQYYAYQQFEEKVAEEELQLTLTGFSRVESRFENRVYLDPYKKDEYGVPKIQVDYSYTNEDYRVGNQMIDGVIQSKAAMNLVSTASRPVIRPAGSDMHESCTCRMGVNPETSVTNPNGQVYGVSGLYVADSSLLPTLAAANPVLSNVALALRVSDNIVRAHDLGGRPHWG